MAHINVGLTSTGKGTGSVVNGTMPTSTKGHDEGGMWDMRWSQRLARTVVLQLEVTLPQGLETVLHRLL